MNKLLTLMALSLSLGVSPASLAQSPPPLRLIPQEQTKTNCCQWGTLGWDEQLWNRPGQRGDRAALLASIDHSLRYLRTPKAAEIYRNYPVEGITLERVQRSLQRFRQLVVSARSASDLQRAVQREFVFYQAVGQDNNGGVKFTAYYEPVYRASRTRTETFRYPIYRIPDNFEQWAKPHPSRVELEGAEGQSAASSPVKGMELAWLSDRLEAYLVQIQGSAQLQLTDGSLMTVGFAGGTDYPYISIGRELIKDGKLPAENLTMPILIDYFRKHPQELDGYITRNNRFVFFRETNGAPASGSIGVPVTAERSIATDKSLMPPGALALVRTSLPFANAQGNLQQRLVSRFVLDQDAGSAILGPGRVDYFMGTGKVAGDRAGITGGIGELYYLLLKETE